MARRRAAAEEAKAAPAAEAAPEAEAETEEDAAAAAEAEAAYDLSGWSGKTPKTMLLEWFQKRQQPRPRFELEQQGRKFRAAVVLNAGGGGADVRVETPEGEAFERRDQAEQAAATAALLNLFADQPLYRLLPPAYKALWHAWAELKRAPAVSYTHLTLPTILLV